MLGGTRLHQTLDKGARNDNSNRALIRHEKNNIVRQLSLANVNILNRNGVNQDNGTASTRRVNRSIAH